MQIAQTNLQLYNQLAAAGWSMEALSDTDRAYQMAIKLFTGRYRANGKVFLAHLVGTASILAHFGAPQHVVLAGLLHAAYLQGEFGNGKPGVTAARRKWMLQAVAPEVNALLEGYAKLRWKPDYLAEIEPVAADLPAEQQTLLWMRIANALEDQIHFASHYSTKRLRDQGSEKSRDEWAVEIAHTLGHHELANALAAELNAQPFPGIERLQRPGSGSATVAPLTHRIKPLVGLRLAAVRTILRFKGK